MTIQFFRSEPDAPVVYPSQSADDDSGIAVVLFERHNDPDALNHLGCDFYGAHGDGDLIAAWAEDQPLEAIDRDQLPEQLTWFPAPFNEA